MSFIDYFIEQIKIDVKGIAITDNAVCQSKIDWAGNCKNHNRSTTPGKQLTADN
jgi:hypothetical protein